MITNVDLSRTRARETARPTARIVATEPMPDPRPLIARGFSVFPLIGKIPAASLLPLVKNRDGEDKPSWTPFQTRRATDFEIRQWQRHRPAVNWAITTGKLSGFFTIDADTPEQVAAWRTKLPPTQEVSTGRGVHFRVTYPTDGTEIRSTTHKAWGWDVRGEGGYVVAEGSVHPSGAIYTSNGLPIADAPDWLIAELLQQLEKPPGNVHSQPVPRPSSNDYKISDYAKAQAAIDAINSAALDDYDTWLRIGLSLSTLGSAGLPLWDTLSARNSKYKPGECERKWASFGKRTGVNLATLFYHADQDDPTWRKRFNERQHASQPTELDKPNNSVFASAPNTETPQIAESESTGGALGWPVELPKAIERAILAWLKTSAAIFLRAVLLGIRAGTVKADSFTLTDIVSVSSVAERTLRNGLSGVLDVFIAEASDQIELLPISDIRICTIGGSDHPPLISENGRNSQGGRPSVVYRLLPFDQAVANLLQRVILPRRVEKRYADCPEKAPSLPALLRAFHCDDPAVAEEVKAIVGKSVDTPEYKSLRQDYNQWRIDLSDRSGAALQGEWKTPRDYKKAVIERDLMGKQVPRKQTVAVCGLTAEQVDALLPELEAIREEQHEYRDYEPGKPIRKAIKDGRLSRLEVFWPDGRQPESEPVDIDAKGEIESKTRWAAEKMQSGAIVICRYNTASLYRKATAEELQQAELDHGRRSAIAKARAERRKPVETPIGVKPAQRTVEYRGLDHSPEFARRWLASMERLYGFTICEGSLVRLADDVRQSLALIDLPPSGTGSEGLIGRPLTRPADEQLPAENSPLGESEAAQDEPHYASPHDAIRMVFGNMPGVRFEPVQVENEAAR